MKKILAGFCFILAVQPIAAFADVTIGVNISTTGPIAALGIPNKNALQFAPTTIAGQKIKYVVLDDQSDTTTAVQNVKRLVTENNIDLLLGPSVTPTTLAVMDTVATAKTALISFGSASKIISPMDKTKKWVFKTTPNDELYIDAMTNHMLVKKIKTISMIAVDDPYGESWVRVTKEYAAKKGIKVIDVEKFQRLDTSTTSQTLKVMKNRPDAVLVICQGTPAATPHRSLVEHGYKGIIYQTGGVANTEFLKVGGKAVEGAYLPCPPIIVAEQLPKGYPIREEALKFIGLYEGKFGAGSRSTFAAHFWDAVKLMEYAIPKALKKAKPGTQQFREALRQEIESARGVAGADAVYNMSPTDHSGINQLGIVMVKIVNGSWKLEQYSKDY
jgi:branched-chain amino acid transport system substrate-binding protein